MKYVDEYGDEYDVHFRRYKYKNDHGIEAVTCGEVYSSLGEWEPEYFVRGRHEHPKRLCLWSRDDRLVDLLVKDGKAVYTGRTTEYYGVKLREFKPVKKWIDSLPTFTY